VCGLSLQQVPSRGLVKWNVHVIKVNNSRPCSPARVPITAHYDKTFTAHYDKTFTAHYDKDLHSPLRQDLHEKNDSFRVRVRMSCTPATHPSSMTALFFDTATITGARFRSRNSTLMGSCWW